MFSNGSSWPRAGLCNSLPPALSLLWLPPCDAVLIPFLVIQLFKPCLGQPTFLHATVHGGSAHLPSPRGHSGCLGSGTSCCSHPAMRKAHLRPVHAFPESWTEVMLAIPSPVRASHTHWVIRISYKKTIKKTLSQAMVSHHTLSFNLANAMEEEGNFSGSQEPSSKA